MEFAATLLLPQVHQRDVFMDLARLVKERKITSSSDFEWLKQVSLICKRKRRVVVESKQAMISHD